MKYKIGEKVKIKPTFKLVSVVNSVACVITNNGKVNHEKYLRHQDKIATIIDVDNTSYRIDLDNGKYKWNGLMFIKI